MPFEKTKDRIIELLSERGFHPSFERDQKGMVVIFHDSHGNRHEIRSSTKIENLWWLDDRYKAVDPKDSFDEWLRQLDRIFNANYGIGYQDVEDYDWYAEFESECTPRESFEEWRLLNGSTTLGG